MTPHAAFTLLCIALVLVSLIGSIAKWMYDRGYRAGYRQYLNDVDALATRGIVAGKVVERNVIRVPSWMWHRRPALRIVERGRPTRFDDDHSPRGAA